MLCCSLGNHFCLVTTTTTPSNAPISSISLSFFFVFLTLYSNPLKLLYSQIKCEQNITQLLFCLPSSFILTLLSSWLLCLLCKNLPGFLSWVTCLSISDRFSWPSVPIFFLRSFPQTHTHTGLFPKGCNWTSSSSREFPPTVTHPSHLLYKHTTCVPPIQ